MNTPISVSLKWVANAEFAATTMNEINFNLDKRITAGGSGKFATPTDHLLAAVGGCTGIDVVDILKKMRQELKSLIIEVIGEQAEEHPKYFRKILIRYTVSGSDLDREKVEHAVQLSQEKYCSVRATLTDRCHVVTEIVTQEL